MPIYAYECDTCKLSFDRYNTVQNRAYYDCPECGKPVKKILSIPRMSADLNVRDLNGTPIWYPPAGGKHYDRVLKKTFYSKKEKADYMKEQRIVMDGSSDPASFPVEAGDMRNKSYRTQMENLKEPIK